MKKPRPLVGITIAMVLCQAAYAADSVTPPSANSGTAVPTYQPSFQGLTPAQEQAAQDLWNKIRQEHLNILPIGPDQVSTDLNKEIQMKRTAEYLEWVEKMKGTHGSNPTENVTTQLGGGFSATTSWVAQPAHFRETRHLSGAGGSFQIIEANENLLDDMNRRVNKIENKIKKSKFACGNFDWVVQLKGKFNKEALKKYVDKLGESALAAAPMAFLANWSPTLYEIVKFLRVTASAELDADKIDCSTMESALTDIGQKTLRGPGFAECLRANQSLGTTEAHRVCRGANGGESPFDGVENTVGKIVSFAGDAQDINLTDMLADAVREPNVDKKRSLEIQKTNLEKNLVDAEAELAANPNPGEPPPGAMPGDAAYVAWYEHKTKYDNAKRRRDEIARGLSKTTEQLIQAQQGITDAGAFGRFRTSLADNLSSIIGDFDFSAKADILFGKQRRYHLKLRYKHIAYEHSLDFVAQLRTHYQILMANPVDATELAASYDRLHAYCFATMQAPWLEREPFPVESGVLSTEVRCGYLTLDRLAFLWCVHQASPDGSVPRTVWPDLYMFIEAINLISQFELYDYLYWKTKDEKDKVIQEVQNMDVFKKAGPQVIDAIIKAISDYEQFLKDNREEPIQRLAICLHAVNKFIIKTPKAAQGPTNRVLPGLGTSDEPRLGR